MGKIDTELVSRLSGIRGKANLTQEHLARVAGVSRQTISAIEKGDYNPSAALALRLAVLLGKSVHELFQLPETEAAALRRVAFDVSARTSSQVLGSVEDTVAANVDKEKEVLEAIRRHGEITVTGAALETSLSVVEADRMLSELAVGGHLQVHARGGGLLYAFWE